MLVTVSQSLWCPNWHHKTSSSSQYLESKSLTIPLRHHLGPVSYGSDPHGWKSVQSRLDPIIVWKTMSHHLLNNVPELGSVHPCVFGNRASGFRGPSPMTFRNMVHGRRYRTYLELTQKTQQSTIFSRQAKFFAWVSLNFFSISRTAQTSGQL